MEMDGDDLFSRMPDGDGDARVARLYTIDGRARPLGVRTHRSQIDLAERR